MELNLKQRAFLAAFAELGSVRGAALAARVARRSDYYWLTQPHYAAAFREARQEAFDTLMAEAWHRGVEGVEVPLFYQGKMCFEREFDAHTGQMRTTHKPLTIRNYSDTLLMFVAKGRDAREVPRQLDRRTPLTNSCVRGKERYVPIQRPDLRLTCSCCRVILLWNNHRSKCRGINLRL